MEFFDFGERTDITQVSYEIQSKIIAMLNVVRERLKSSICLRQEVRRSDKWDEIPRHVNWDVIKGWLEILKLKGGEGRSQGSR